MALWVSAILACNFSQQQAESSLATRLGTHLNRVIEVEAEASDLWDRVLFGDVVSCSETLDFPPVFEMAVDEVEVEPLSLTVHDHLNLVLVNLQEAADIWARECQLERTMIPLDVVRQAATALETARIHLMLAAEAWDVWQS